MNRKSIALTLACVLVFVICQGAMSADEFSNVSLVQLIANPDLFNGKPIQVVGYLTVEFENVELYLHREDAERALYKNGVWVELSREEMKKYSRLNLKYVIIEGVFDSKQLGHMGSTSGTIAKISKLEVLPTNIRAGHPAP
jgi:hypothetical protein